MIFALALALLSVVSIKGPQSAQPGELIILDGSKSEGDGFRWILPAGTNHALGSSNTLALTVDESVTVYLVGVSDGKIEVAGHRIEVSEPDSRPNLIVKSKDFDGISKWMQEMHESLVAVGWRIMYLQADIGTPEFRVTLSNGHTETVGGYLTPANLVDIKERGGTQDEE